MCRAFGVSKQACVMVEARQAASALAGTPGCEKETSGLTCRRSRPKRMHGASQETLNP